MWRPPGPILPFYPSPLVGEGGEIERSEMEPDEGSASAERDPSPGFAEFIIGRRFAPTRWRSHLSHKGRG
jgi:hypothetical protein